jgi:hypothetical protein
MRNVRSVLLVMALIMGGSGAALIALARSDDAPPLDSMEKSTGGLESMQLHRYGSSKGGRSPYLVFRIGGLLYTLESGRLAWLDSIRATLHGGDPMTVWSTETPIGSGQIWQLKRGDSAIVSYAERQDKKARHNGGTIQFGKILIGIGLVGLVAALLVPLIVSAPPAN